MTSPGLPRSTGFEADLGRAVALSDFTHLTQKTNAAARRMLSLGRPHPCWCGRLCCGIPAGCSTLFLLLSAILPFSMPFFFRFFAAIHRCMLQTIFGTINVSGNAYISIHRVELHKARLFRSRLTEPFHLHARQFRRRAQFCTRREVFVQILHKRVPPTVVQPQMGMQNMGIGLGPASKLLLQLPTIHQTDPPIAISKPAACPN